VLSKTKVVIFNTCRFRKPYIATVCYFCFNACINVCVCVRGVCVYRYYASDMAATSGYQAHDFQ